MTREDEVREAIVAEAESWVGTAYHHMGRVKIRRDVAGAVVERGGTDCGQLVYLVFHTLGLCGELALEAYPMDWHMHRDQERYLAIVLERASEVPGPPRPGDIVLYKWGRLFAHGGIVVEAGSPAMIVHADAIARRVIRSRADAGKLAGRETRYFSVFA